MENHELRIEYLEPLPACNNKGGGSDDAGDISAAENEALALLARSDEERKRFWAMFHAFYEIQAWGFDVYQFMHGCPCPEHATTKPKRPCCWNGRRMLELSAGLCQEFLKKLQALTLSSPNVDASSVKASKIIKDLENSDPAYIRLVNECFAFAKSKVGLRFQQGTAYYSAYPWTMCRLLTFIQQPSGPKRDKARAASRSFAKALWVVWATAFCASG